MPSVAAAEDLTPQPPLPRTLEPLGYAVSPGRRGEGRIFQVAPPLRAGDDVDAVDIRAAQRVGGEVSPWIWFREQTALCPRRLPT
jgi:hypothetical protein